MTKFSITIGTVACVAALLQSAPSMAAALACDRGLADMTVVRGEIVTPRERDVRVGWLALTYIEAALGDLQDRHGQAALHPVGQALQLVVADAECARQAADRPEPAERAGRDLKAAQTALAAGDLTVAQRELDAAARNLYPVLITLDDVLARGATGTPPDGRGVAATAPSSGAAMPSPRG
jgi:hypothetical protein